MNFELFFILIFIENVALNKLLGKIRKQREEVSCKSSELNVSVNDVYNDVNNQKKSKDEHPVELQELHQESNFWSPRSINDLGHNIQELVEVDQSDILLNRTNDSLNDLNSTSSTNQTQTRNQKLIKGIMMSSHNVSSLHEIESRFINRYCSNHI